MKIWYQSMSDIEQLPGYRSALVAHAASLLDASTSVEVHGVRPGTYGAMAPVEVLRHPYAFHVMLEQVIGNCIRAEQTGCDVVVLGSYSEPFLRECRSAVDIPVASMAESTLLVACSVAAKVGLVTLTEQVAWMIEQHVARHRLEARVARVRALSEPVTEHDLVAAFADPSSVVELFSEAARAAIADRADVIIPAEGVLNELIVASGVRAIDGVSIMDGVGVSLLYGEMMGRLHLRTGLAAGRRWSYPSAGPQIRALLHEHATHQPLSAVHLGDTGPAGA